MAPFFLCLYSTCYTISLYYFFSRALTMSLIPFSPWFPPLAHRMTATLSLHSISHFHSRFPPSTCHIIIGWRFFSMLQWIPILGVSFVHLSLKMASSVGDETISAKSETTCRCWITLSWWWQNQHGQIETKRNKTTSRKFKIKDKGLEKQRSTQCNYSIPNVTIRESQLLPK